MERLFTHQEKYQEKHQEHQEKLFAHRQARPAQKAPTNLGSAAKKVHASMTTADDSMTTACQCAACLCVHLAQFEDKRVLFCLLMKRVLYVQVRHSDAEIRNENIAMLLRERPPVDHKHTVEQQQSPKNRILTPHIGVTGESGGSGRAGVCGASAATTTSTTTTSTWATRIAAQVQRQLISARLQRAATLGVVAVEGRDGSGSWSDGHDLVHSSHLQSHLQGDGVADSGRRGAEQLAEQYRDGLGQLSHPQLSHHPPPVCGHA